MYNKGVWIIMLEVDFKDIEPGDIYMHSLTDAWSYKAVRQVPVGELADELIPPQKFEHPVMICYETTKPTKYYYSVPQALYYLIQKAETEESKLAFAKNWPDICNRCGKPAKVMMFTIKCSDGECR